MEHLRAQIDSGELKPGDQLPSEAEMCAEFNTSRGPVRQAIAALRAEGAISSGRGRRSVVLSANKAESFESILSTTTWLEEIGLEPGAETQWMARRPAPANVAEGLSLNEGDPIIFVYRKRLADGQAISLERLYFPLDIGQKILNFDADNGSIHAHLREEGVEFDNARRTLVFSRATAEDAPLLEVEPNAPLIKVYLEASDHVGTPMEYAEVLYRPEHLKFATSNVRGGFSPIEVSVDLPPEPMDLIEEVSDN